MAVDLSKYTLVLNEEFNSPLDLYDGKSGIWTTAPRRDVLVSNSPYSVFLSENTATSEGKGVGLNSLEVKDGVLHIKSGVIPDANRAAVNDALDLAGQSSYAKTVNYYTGMIATDQTWGQAYGFFEIKAQVPAGKGHWPAFWLAAAGIGWPPEIDIFEAYGKGLDKRTGADNQFNTAVFFDKVDINGNATQNVDLTNPYNIDANGNAETPEVRTKAGGEQYQFHDRTNALTEFGADIYSGFWVYACEWTPENIIFYFGKDHNSLVEIYRTPTPQDVTTPMYMIANDQIGSTFGWNPVAGQDHLTFAQGNDLKIDYIKTYAYNPTATLKGSGKGATIVDGDRSTTITGTKGDDLIVTGKGQDIVSLGGGKDTVFVGRDIHNKILSGFGSDDKIVLEGFSFDGIADVLSRLTQVGNDVWLANGAAPGDPQTIAFKDIQVSQLSAANFVVRWSTTPDIWSSALHDATRLKDDNNDGLVTARADGSKLTDAGSAFKGAMTLAGSTAGDLYYVYNSTTKVTEKANGGVDTVYAFKDYVLGDNIENLVAGNPREGLSLTGNAMNNRIEGTTAGEILAGGKGDDLIVTGGGADRVVYNAGDGYDTIVGFDRDDILDLRGIRFESFAQLQSRLIASGEDTLLDLGNGQAITFRGTLIEKLSAANFVFEVGVTNVVGKGADPYYVPSQNVAGVEDKAEVPVTVPGGSSGPVTSPVELVLQGGVGADTLRATTDQTYKINAGGGDDTVTGRNGNDQIRGDAGNDNLHGGGGDDTIWGGDGNDRIVGWTGHDTLYGDAGDDSLIGNEGNDLLYGGDGKDNLQGGDGNDLLDGGAGDDILIGGTGNDILRGGLGSDRLTGNEGADRFILGARNSGDIDRIMDFSYREGDRIDVSALVPAQANDLTIGTFLRLQDSKSFVAIQIDRDGAGTAHGFETVAQVMGANMTDVMHGIDWHIA